MPTGDRDEAHTDYLSLFRLDGSVALVTGAGGGIGAQSCMALCQAGARVICADLDEAAAHRTAEELIAWGGSATGIALDVTEEAAVAAAFDQLATDAGRLDILVNNAGIFPMRPLAETSWQQWDAIQNVNLRGTFGCLQVAIPLLTRSDKASVINLSSMSAFIPSASNLAPYAASKAGVAALTRSAAFDLAPLRIRVNAIAPGPVQTDGARTNERHGAVRGAMTDPARYLHGRSGEPWEIAALVLFLASAASSYINGRVILADGGFTLT